MKTNQQTTGSFTLIVIFTLITLLSFKFSFAQSGWYKLSSGTVSDLNAVFFVNSMTGWAVGVDKIIKTTNGGSTWTWEDYNTGENDWYTFKSICFTNSMTGWIAGDLYKIIPGVHYNIVIKTTNGGNNWSGSYSSPNPGLNSVCYRTLEAGYSVGFNAIIKSTNQGLTWTEQDFPKGENDDVTFNSICFNNPLLGWAAGDVYVNPPGVHQKIIYKTESGGQNWEMVYRSGEIGLNSVNFCNTANGWAVSNNEIMTSHNGGANWIIQQTYGGLNAFYFLKSVFFINSSIGWVAGGKLNTFGNQYSSVIIKTTNEGLNWTEQTFTTNGHYHKLNFVYFINELTGWAVGDGGDIYKTTDGGMTNIKTKSKTVPDSYSLEQNYPNPFNAVTKIKFDIAGNTVEQTCLSVYNILGKEIAVLVNEKLNPGTYEVTFDAGDLPSGIYFYQLKAKDFSVTKKLILQK